MAEIRNTPGRVKLDPRRKELMHRVMDGDPDLRGVMHILNGYKFCDNFLTWMIENRFTGKNLREIIISRFRGSVPDLVDFMTREMNLLRAEELREKIRAGAPEG